jgi:uncharacterized protein YqeY
MGASGMKDMGKVVNAANQQLAGKAESKTIAMMVKASTPIDSRVRRMGKRLIR